MTIRREPERQSSDPRSPRSLRLTDGLLDGGRNEAQLVHTTGAFRSATS
jgi:hypothetical protein